MFKQGLELLPPHGVAIGMTLVDVAGRLCTV
ncbi:MAG: hypothetical protein ACI9PN_002386, partial [Candidatus Azotimanducaceae bacterium]